MFRDKQSCGHQTMLWNQACLRIINAANREVQLWTQREDCRDCKLLMTATYKGPGFFVHREPAVRLKYSLIDQAGHVLCNGFNYFGQLGHYSIQARNDSSECQLSVVEEPLPMHMHVLIFLVVFIPLISIWHVGKILARKYLAGFFLAECAEKEWDLKSDEAGLKKLPATPKAPRLNSLDTFRGLCVVFMFLANLNYFDGYYIIKHVVWYGCSIADLILPSFEFAMGFALVLSINSRLKYSSRATVFRQVFRRFVKIFMIGVIELNVLQRRLWDPRKFSLSGTLQRLAAAYLIVAGLETALAKPLPRATPGGMSQVYSGIKHSWLQWLVTIVLVIFQVLVMLFVSAPGCPQGYMGPGGIHGTAHGVNDLANCTGGISFYIDRLVFGVSPFWSWLRDTYHTTLNFYQLGILTTLTHVLIVQVGAQAARIAIMYPTARERLVMWMSWAVGIYVFAFPLYLIDLIPVVPKVASLSFCLLSSAMALTVFCCVYYIVDVKGWWDGRPLYYCGRNSLGLYIVAILYFGHTEKVYKFLRGAGLWPARITPGPTWKLAVEATVVTFWMAVSAALHARRIFITM